MDNAKETKSKRGKNRVGSGYHASRGWFYGPVQKIIRKWNPVFGWEFTHQTWLEMRRTMENGRGNLDIYIQSKEHRRFVCELMTALDKLFDHENCNGWAIRVWPQWSKTTGKLMQYPEMQALIRQMGGPTFTVDALKQAARRLKLLVTDEQQKERDEQSWMHQG